VNIQLKIRDLFIATGGPHIVVVNKKDALQLGLHFGSRVRLKRKNYETIAIVDLSDSNYIVPEGYMGLFEETQLELRACDNDSVDVESVPLPMSVNFIKKKIRGKSLLPNELYSIIKDLVDNKLSEVEITYFVAGTYFHGLSLKETIELAKALVNTGQRLRLKGKYIMDKHSIGGVPGNRTTMIVVPIVSAAGLTIPKTSSRAITSPAGTADTMEVLAEVNLELPQMETVIAKTGACMVWGGSLNLAPADDKIIKVEYPLQLDAEGQMLASVMAKKYSVSATHVLIDIPVGPQVKVHSIKEAKKLRSKFVTIGKSLGMKIEVYVSDGRQPIGNGIGPALEARDVLYCLMNDRRAPRDLLEKSLIMAGRLLEMGKKAKKGKGKAMAEKLLKSKEAYKQMIHIIRAQGERATDPDKLKLGSHTYSVKASRKGKVRGINNYSISQVARSAGAPLDKGAGVDLHVRIGHSVKRGDKLFTVYAENSENLRRARHTISSSETIVIK